MKVLKTPNLVFKEILFFLKNTLHIMKATSASLRLCQIADSASSKVPRTLQFFQSVVLLEI